MAISTGIIIWVIMCWRWAKPRHITDKRLIDLIPKGFRPHESFIVKSSGKKPREHIIKRADIKF